MFFVRYHRTPPFYVDLQFSIANLGLNPVIHTDKAEPTRPTLLDFRVTSSLGLLFVFDPHPSSAPSMFGHLEVVKRLLAKCDKDC